jgi:hypothetical protein
MRQNRNIYLLYKKAPKKYDNQIIKIHFLGPSAELLQNAVEASNLYLSEEDSLVSEKNIACEIDIKQFFQYYRVINSKFPARRIGMNETLLSQYVQGKKKPSPFQINKILTGIQEIGQELVHISLFAK